ncbi:MAG TPA: EamA family transporter, partial [Desulfatiglandales bacterium]|nr:EamA family transporter [Desulfatiglandales bacterium]
HSARINHLKGYLCVIGAAVLWASSGIAGKVLFKGGITPFELVQIRVTFSTVLLAAFFMAFFRDSFRIRIKDLGYFFLLGGISMAMVQGAYFFAISKIQVSVAILLEYLAPILVAFFSVCFWKERLTFSKLSALLLSFAGCYLAVGGYNIHLLRMNRAGIVGGLVSAVCMAGYTLLGEKGMHRYQPLTVLFYALAFATLTWHLLYPPFHYIVAGFTLIQWGWILYIVVMGTIVPFGLYFVGINYIRSTKALITATLEPISAGFMAFFFLRETLEHLQILGGVIVVIAIVLLQLRREQDEMAPELIRIHKR